MRHRTTLLKSNQIARAIIQLDLKTQLYLL
uniref:Uncharacterized protein n=1 Tax=Arundo donax TaxID=35708 RepID=A0A0A9FW86_ARUDO